MTHWVKLHSEINSDPRVDMVSLAAQAVYMRLWPELDADACFRAVPTTTVAETVARLVRRTPEEVAPLLAELARFELVFLFADRVSIPRFLSRNARTFPERDAGGEGSRGGKTSAQRSKEYRDRKAAEKEAERAGDTASRHGEPVTETVTNRDASRDGDTGRMATEDEQSSTVAEIVTAQTAVEQRRTEERDPERAPAHEAPATGPELRLIHAQVNAALSASPMHPNERGQKLWKALADAADGLVVPCISAPAFQWLAFCDIADEARLTEKSMRRIGAYLAEHGWAGKSRENAITFRYAMGSEGAVFCELVDKARAWVKRERTAS